MEKIIYGILLPNQTPVPIHCPTLPLSWNAMWSESRPLLTFTTEKVSKWVVANDYQKMGSFFFRLMNFPCALFLSMRYLSSRYYRMKNLRKNTVHYLRNRLCLRNSKALKETLKKWDQFWGIVKNTSAQTIWLPKYSILKVIWSNLSKYTSVLNAA
jgi:hypothetical protein